jgi:AraC-like DNA-binding protein
MAARLHLTPRTRHRRLVEAGTGYQKIIDNVRRRLAEEFLRNTGLSVEEIAERTGFSDASNFRKAFRKWTGEPPADYRLRTSPGKE